MSLPNDKRLALSEPVSLKSLDDLSSQIQFVEAVFVCRLLVSLVRSDSEIVTGFARPQSRSRL